MSRRWDHWRSGQHDATPLRKLCLLGAVMGVATAGFGELLLRLAA